MNTMGWSFLRCFSRMHRNTAAASRMAFQCSPPGPPAERALRIHQGDGGHLQQRYRDQGSRRGTQAVKDRVHCSALPEALQKSGDDEDHDDGGAHQSQRSDHAAWDAGHMETHIGGHIHPHGAGGGLRHGDHIGQLSRGEPAGAVPDIRQKGDGGKAAAH